MGKIYELDRHVANLIAAGEVVERPASVVKELTENSIDAGAGIITVEIKSGGMAYIRVTDNGCGIAAEDAKTAFLRHATSKLRTAAGLDSIETLGFRGEALAAIASVSRIELLSRERGADEGVRLTLEGGVVTDFAPFGCPEGTTIIVRDLFYNTPARHKFMKSDRAEGSGVYTAVVRCALSHPEVSVRFIKDGKTECHTPGDTRIDSCVYNLFGREFESGLIKARSSGDSISVEGYISRPTFARGNRSYQFFFVNGRHIRSKILQAALERAYDKMLTSGRYPSCVLYITTKTGDVDVNVHPAKTEVRFISEKQVFDEVYYAACGALEGSYGQSGNYPDTNNAAPRVTGGVFNAPARETPSSPYAGTGTHSSAADFTHVKETTKGGFKSVDAGEFRKSFSPGGFKSGVKGDAERFSPDRVENESREPYQTRMTARRGEFDLLPEDTMPRYIGEAMNTYIIAERGGSIWFIDKHAAHERICYDKLRLGNGKVMQQALLTPVICRQSAEDTEILLQNAKMLSELGFSVESFGEDAVAVRGIPSDIRAEDTEAVLSEICAELLRGGIPGNTRRDNILKTVACKAAVRAGELTDRRELEVLILRVFSGEVRYCPHGRPVVYEITKSWLERSFKRI